MPSYWLNLFTYRTWTEFLDAGGQISGFRDSRWTTAQKLKEGDIFLCYITGISRWIGTLRVQGPAYRDATRIWGQAVFPVRVPVEVVQKLAPETAIPIRELADELSIFQNLKNPHAWTGRLRGSPVKWSQQDGEAVVRAIDGAVQNPVSRPFDERKLHKTPPLLRTADDEAVTIPDDENDQADEKDLAQPAASLPETTRHSEIQWTLLKLGNDMGLHVWVAANDRNKVVHDRAFQSIPRLLHSLPVQFDDASRRTIELIDVLWLRGQAIVAAFEIESTTSIYSGLLRMSDLISMQPNLAIPLYIVAPDERRSKVFAEIRRPTFARLPQPLADVCRFIPFSELERQVEQAAAFTRHLRPNFIDDFAETCKWEED